MFSCARIALLIALLFPVPSMAFASTPGSLRTNLLQEKRSSPGDLEIGGELTGLSAGTLRYVRYEDLLRLPLETYTVSDDSNFKGQTEITGVPLTSLARLFGKAAHSDLIVAICYDKYRSNYPSDYLKDHHPLLVLKINGKTREDWPKSEYGGALGPYLISHPPFKPSFQILSHPDEAQIPFGVSRLDFRTQSVVFGAIRPAGDWPKDSQVSQGYRIASQDCYRCHSSHGEGGELASRDWLILAAWAATDAKGFQKYIHDPKSIQPSAKMQAHKSYDQATLEALTAYYATFIPHRKKQ